MTSSALVSATLVFTQSDLLSTNNCTNSSSIDLATNSSCDMLTSPLGAEQHFGHTLGKPFATFAGVCFLLIVIIAVVCNVILILTILSVKRLHSVTHVFIINLAVGDLITAVVTIPFDIDFMWRGHFSYSRAVCGIMHVSFLLSLPSSVINLCLLTVDRFISVQWPFRKMRWFSKRNIIIALIISWAYTFTVALFPIMYNPDAVFIDDGYCILYPLPLAYDVFLLVVNFLVPILIILTMNILLFTIANEHGKKIQKLTKTATTNKENPLQRTHTRRDTHRKSSLSFGANIKAAKRILLLVGVFVVCWLSYIILVTTNLSCNECHPRELTWMGNVVNYSSVAINPVLYGLLNKTVRKEVLLKVRQVLAKCLRRGQSTLSVRLTVFDPSPYSESGYRKRTCIENGQYDDSAML